MTFKFGHFEILEFILCFTAKLCSLYGTQGNATLNSLTCFLIKNIHTIAFVSFIALIVTKPQSNCQKSCNVYSLS